MINAEASKKALLIDVLRACAAQLRSASVSLGNREYEQTAVFANHISNLLVKEDECVVAVVLH